MSFAVNFSPAMTRHLIEDRRAFALNPIVIVDVGARWGMNSEWAAFGDQMRVYCFEADKEECARLAAAAPPNVTYLPTAVGRASGTATLYVAKLPAATGLYKQQMDYVGRLVNRDNGLIVGEETIEVRSLSDVMAANGIPAVDFIKLDAEGAELDILQGGEDMLRSPGFLGVLSEIRLHEEINKSPPFAELDTFLRQRGLRLHNLHVTRQSRIVLPYPQLGDYRLPDGERFFAYTTHGQVQDGDALYFRNWVPKLNLGPVQLLKLACFLELYCLADCAAELVSVYREEIASIADPDHLLDLLATSVAGKATSYHEYLADYFEDKPKTQEPSVTAMDSTGKSSWFKRLFGRQ